MTVRDPLTYETMSGLWVDQEGRLYALDADGVLGLPGQTDDGVSWSFDGQALELRTLSAPGENETSKILTLRQKNLFSIEFSDGDGDLVVWKKSRKKVKRLEGTLFYRERMMLPPEVYVRVGLSSSCGGREYHSLRLANGHDQLSFRLHYLAGAFEGSGLLSASVFYGKEPLFATQSPVRVELEGKPSVLLHHAVLCSEPSSLVGTYWRLSELDGTPAEHFAQQPEAHLILKDKGQAVGSDGCNNFFMTWTEEEGKLTFTPGGATLRLCPNGEEQALRMHRMFPAVDSWQIKDATLELYSKGSVAAAFEAVDM
ncbi:MAG: META domain-containing protein [Mailhella sp.]|nr:META domain-containing protein [Mailhella sp.]